MNDLQLFNFKQHEIRVIADDPDNPQWVAADVAKILGYHKAPDMTRGLDADEKGYVNLRTPGGEQRLSTISEAGLYKVILTRNAQMKASPEVKAQIKAFQRWVTHEVLPSIRKRGAYLTPATIEEVLTNPDTIIKLATDLKLEQQRRLELESENQQLTPKAEYYDTFVADEDLIQFRTVANQLNIGEQALRNLLIEKRWIYRIEGKRWSNKREQVVTEYQYRPHADKKPYFRLVPCHEAPRVNGEVRQTLKITPQGAERIATMVKRWGGVQTQIDAA